MASNYFDFLNKYNNLLGEIEGITESEISQIELDFNVKLPKAYKDFLKVCGKETGQLLSSYLMEVHKLRQNRDSAIGACVDELSGKRVEVKESYFFFAQWQGYNFFFFDCEDPKEDPAVFLLSDSPAIAPYKESFTEFIRNEGIKPLVENYQ